MRERIPKRIPKRGGLHSEGAVENVKVVITAGTMIKFLLVIFGFFMVWYLREIIGLVFVALVFASALDPWVDKLARLRIPRWFSILGFFAGTLLVVGFTVYAIIPPFMEQMTEIVNSLPQLAPQIDSAYQYVTQQSDASLTTDLQSSVSSLSSSVSQITSGVYDAAVGLAGWIAAIILALVLTFYMTVDEDSIKKFIRSTAPIQFQPYLVQKVNRIQSKMGAWLRGQLIVMLVIGLLSFLALMLLGVEYALVLAVIAGLFEFVPFIGPFLSAVPAVFFAFADSPWKALAVGIAYVIIQQIENQIVVPKVMEKAVGLNPIVVIVTMLIGAKIGGLVGVLLSVPATLILWVFLEDFFVEKQRIENELE